MDLSSIRERSLKIASRLGFAVNKALPLLDEVEVTKAADEAFRRLLCLHATAACAFGFDRRRARTWLEQEGVWGDLTTAERQFVENGQSNPAQFQVQVEGMWALAWALGIVPQLDFGRDCDGGFVMVLPNLKVGQGSDALRSKLNPRTTDEVVAACDLAYCLHWAVREAQLTGSKPPGNVEPCVIEERRRALEWLISDDAWDEVPLDT